MRLAPLVLLGILLVPAGAQPPPPSAHDLGLPQAWSKAVLDALVALPLERPDDARQAILRLDTLARGFADSQILLGGEGSGPSLAAAAPDAAGLRGVGGDAQHIAGYLAVAPAFRARALDAEAQAAAAGQLAVVGEFLQRVRDAASRDPQTQGAWRDAMSWLSRQQQAGQGVVARPPVEVQSSGTGLPGRQVEVGVRGLSGNGTVVSPWGNATPVGPGTSVVRVSVPSNATPGTYVFRVVSDGTTVANGTVRVAPVPLRLEVLGPRQAAAGTEATYRIAMVSPILVPRPGTFNVTALGRAVEVRGDAFTLTFPDEGSMEVVVVGGPGPPWVQGRTSFTLQAVAPAGADPAADLVAIGLVAVAPALLFALALLARARPAGAPHPEAAVPPGPAWGLVQRVRVWWSTPESVVASDYRRAARILAESGDLPPDATHEAVAAALERQGVRPKVAQRLAQAYELALYGGSAVAARDYWKARKEGP